MHTHLRSFLPLPHKVSMCVSTSKLWKHSHEIKSEQILLLFNLFIIMALAIDMLTDEGGLSNNEYSESPLKVMLCLPFCQL